MLKTIKLMSDYYSYPLWGTSLEDMGEIDPITLGLDSDLVADLNQWADKFDSILNENDPASSGFKTKEDEINFEKMGLELWKKLQTVLSSTYKVIYFSCLLGQTFEDVSEFETALKKSCKPPFAIL